MPSSICGRVKTTRVASTPADIETGWLRETSPYSQEYYRCGGIEGETWWGGKRTALGHAIVSVRKRRGMTQVQAAVAAGIPQVTLSRWDNGARMSLDDLARLEEGLGVSRGAILVEAGYVGDQPRLVAEILDRDPTLDQRVRPLVWAAYREAQALSTVLNPSLKGRQLRLKDRDSPDGPARTSPARTPP